MMFYEALDAPTDQIQLTHNNRLHHTPLHTHNFYEILLVSDGKAIHHVNNTTEVIQHKQVSLIRPADCHYYRDYYDCTFAYYNLHIPQGAWNRLLSVVSGNYEWIMQAKTPPLVRLPHRDYVMLTERLDRFDTMPAGESKRLLYDIILQEVLYLILTLEKDTSTHTPPWFHDLLLKLQEPAVFIEGLKTLLDISGYSQEYINRSFRKYIGMTPTMYINNLRLDYALDLIANHGYTTLAASQSAGFNHYGYFQMLFKRRYGCPPKEFKHQ